jgi:hypothetical protein
MRGLSIARLMANSALSTALGVLLWLGMVPNVVGLSLARDGLAGLVFVLGLVWAIVVGLLFMRRAEL